MGEKWSHNTAYTTQVAFAINCLILGQGPRLTYQPYRYCLCDFGKGLNLFCASISSSREWVSQQFPPSWSLYWN